MGNNPVRILGRAITQSANLEAKGGILEPTIM